MTKSSENKIDWTILHSILFPQSFYFQFKTIDNKTVVFPIDRSEAYVDLERPRNCDYDIPSHAKKSFPSFPSREIHVNYAFLSSGQVAHVQVDGSEMLCKASKDGLHNQSIKCEILSLLKIQESSSDIAEAIHVPKLLGFVTDADNGDIIGFLGEWILVGSIGGLLGSMEMATISKERREKWAKQIRDTVSQLHKIDVVWGDGKPNNIIIDANDNAQLIDFGGGWTEGWVDKEVADSIAGDGQAVKNIRLFLNIDEQVGE